MSQSDKRENPKRGSTLSLSMIVRNEEKFLAGCLESVREIVDEIVIVDTGSSDATKEVAARYDAKVFDFCWVEDFSAARNYSLAQCTGGWVLYLDADERLVEDQAAVVRKLISLREVGAYNILIKNPHSLHQGNFNQENSYPRLFRRLPGVKFEGKVHEQVWPSLKRLKLSVRQSSLVIQHLGYGQGYDVVKQKAERNLALLRCQLAENPVDAYARFQIGNSLVVLQQYDEAKPALELALASDRLDGSNRASCYNLLAEIEVKRSNLAGAVELCHKSLELAPKQLMAQWFLSLLYFDLALFAKAVKVLRNIDRLLRVPGAHRSNQIASDLNLTKEDVHKRLAITYEAAGEYTEALVQYLRVVELAVSDEAVAGFLRCAERVDDSRVVIERLTSLTKKHPERKEFFFPLACHHRKLNDLNAARGFIDLAIQAQPLNASAHALAVRWNMEAGEVDAAEKTLALAEAKGLRAFELHKSGLQLSLQKGDVNAAFRHLELMTQTTDADLTPIKNRLVALAAKMSAASSS